MEVTPTLTEKLTWDLEGSNKFEVILENKAIIHLSMCRFGPNDEHCLHSTDIVHIKNIHKALTELICFLERDLGSQVTQATEEESQEAVKTLNSL